MFLRLIKGRLMLVGGCSVEMERQANIRFLHISKSKSKAKQSDQSPLYKGSQEHEGKTIQLNTTKMVISKLCKAFSQAVHFRRIGTMV